MIDLVCLVADKNMQAGIDGILRRPQALGIREIQFETIVHPRHDPGCFHEASELLAGYRGQATNALIVLDLAWDGAPATAGDQMEEQLESSLATAGLAAWARAVVIDPELEVWIFSDSPHVETALGWRHDMGSLRAVLARQGLWPADRAKPQDPKAAFEWVLRKARKPRSSSIYRELSRSVSLERCSDRSFLRLKGLLLGWFGSASPER